MLKISIGTIQHKSHRYETVGDFWEKGKRRIVKVSDMANSDYEFMVAMHELIEQHLCLRDGVKECDITAFDIQFEQNRKAGDESEPGDHPDSPYRDQHQFSTKIEKMICEKMGLDWEKYDRTVCEL